MAKRIRNPLPRRERRGLDFCTPEEYQHADQHAKLNRRVKDCWFCFHQAGEHLDHEFIVAKCPDCADNLRRYEAHLQYLADEAARRARTTS